MKPQFFSTLRARETSHSFRGWGIAQSFDKFSLRADCSVRNDFSFGLDRFVRVDCFVSFRLVESQEKVNSKTSARTTWSASMKSTLCTSIGNSTSKNKILYAQMSRCFSVCGFSQDGHLKETRLNSTSIAFASRGRRSLKSGDKKLSINQKWSGALV